MATLEEQLNKLNSEIELFKKVFISTYMNPILELILKCIEKFK